MKKLRKITLVVIIVVVIICILVPVANEIVFHVSIPADLAEAKWRGEWYSEAYPIISGKIVTDLPIKIPDTGKFQVDTFVYYNLWSLFRPGGKLRTSLTGSIDPGKYSGTNEDMDTQVYAPIQITFQLKGGPGLGNQVIDYVATADIYWTIMVGGYRSTEPTDIGVFTLKKE